MDWANLLAMLTGLISTLAGAGPWGLAAIALGMVIIGGVSAWAISSWNRRVDAGDMERAGADAGRTAADLKRQVDNVDKNLDNLSKDFKP